MFSICLCQNLLSNRDPNWTQSCGFLLSSVSGCPRCRLTQKDDEEQMGNRELISGLTTGGVQQTTAVTLFLSHLERMMCSSPNSSMLLHQSMCPARYFLFLECPTLPPHLVSSCSKYQQNGAVKSYKVVYCLLVVQPWTNYLISPSLDSLSIIQDQESTYLIKLQRIAQNSTC